MYSSTAHSFTHAIPHDLEARCAAEAIDWQAVLQAMEQFGVPLVMGVLDAVLTKNYLALLSLAMQYGMPLIKAILAALGKPVP